MDLKPEKPSDTMKHLLRTSLLLAASVGLSSWAGAQGYAGLALGPSRLGQDCSQATACDKQATAYQLQAGYLVAPQWGVEVDYFNRSKSSQTDPGVGTSEWKSDGFGVYGIALAPFERFTLFAKLGVVASDSRREQPLVSESTAHTDLGWGLGAGFQFTRTVGGRLAFDRMRVKFGDSKRDLDLLTLGVTYRF